MSSNRKETFFFISKCLTISIDEKNKFLVEKQIKNSEIDYDKLVELATSHCILPALYCNLRRENLLNYLPSDLVEYMSYITKINRDRNTDILSQSQKLNFLLKENDINPIFLKGTGNLAMGLYSEISERMIGDIDMLISEKELDKVIKILINDGYQKLEHHKDYYPTFRHYSRLIKEDNIAAVEIHTEVIIEDYRPEFNFKKISKETQIANNFQVLNFENQLIHSIIDSQINDNCHYLNIFPLKNAYDTLLLSKKVDNTYEIIQSYNKLSEALNCFFALCKHHFGNLDYLNFNKSAVTKKYLKKYHSSLGKKNFNLIFRLKSYKIILKRKFNKIKNSLFNQKKRDWIIKRIKEIFLL